MKIYVDLFSLHWYELMIKKLSWSWIFSSYMNSFGFRTGGVDEIDETVRQAAGVRNE